VIGPVLLVDAANLMGSRPDGWWRDRAGAARRLVASLGALTPDWTVVCVLEGAARRGVTEGEHAGVRVVHAAGVGDDTLAGLAGPGTTVVTADRGLRARGEEAGAVVLGPRWLLDQL